MESNNIHENMNLIARILNQAKPKFQNGDNSPYWNQLSQQTKAYWLQQKLDLQWMIKHSKEIANVTKDLTYIQNNCIDGDYVNVLVMSTETGQFEALIYRDENTDKDCYEDSILFTQGSLQHISTINKLFKHLEKHIENYMIIVVDLLHCKTKKQDRNRQYNVVWQFEKAKRLRYEHCLQLKYAKLCSSALNYALSDFENFNQLNFDNADIFINHVLQGWDYMKQACINMKMIHDFEILVGRCKEFEFDRGRLYINYNFTIKCNDKIYKYCNLMPYNIEHDSRKEVQWLHNLILSIRSFANVFDNVFIDANTRIQLSNYVNNGFDNWVFDRVHNLKWQDIIK